MVPAFQSKLLTTFVTAFAVMTPPFSFATADERIRFYRERIEPVLKKHCYECHSSDADELEGSLRLDTASEILAGGDTGPSVVAGDAEASLLLKAIQYEYEDLEMPPSGRLPDSTIEDFVEWIESGAAMPDDDDSSNRSREPDYTKAREFWSFQPIRKPPLPKLSKQFAARNPIDAFILRELESNGLTPADLATKRDLIRRVYFDLTGLPPTPEDVDAFVSDSSPLAYEQLVDRLLASPHYGERWAQHWLDVVRFAESEGFEYDRMLPGAWRFRDYVIESFNVDKPYDQFVIEQLAGDELDADNPMFRIAAGFHRLGTVRRNAGNQKVASSRNEVLTERTDIIGAAFLGLTVGCARCHDHKFDPIPQVDYYRMQAFLGETHEDNVILASDSKIKHWHEETNRIQEQIDELKELLKQQTGQEEIPTRKKLAELESQLPDPLPTICSIKNDPARTTPIHFLRRGNPELAEDRVEMHTLGVLTSENGDADDQEASQPRTRLAEWITNSNHPLTARVLVNRIWQQHYGRGLVETANDFGANGARPTHPELLDYLAWMLMEHQWQIKPLQRMIVLSRTYRQSSTKHANQNDPDNRLLSFFPRRRLHSEEIRDAMLAVAGRLNRKAGGKSVMVPVDAELIDQLYKPTQWQVTSDISEHHRRSIYLVAKRNLRLPFMEVFDQPAAQTSCAVREQSTHAPQALELLNGPLSNQLAAALSNRLRAEAGEDAGLQVDRAYLLVAGRLPTAAERRLSVKFIREVSLHEFSLAMFNLNAFLYVN